MTWIGMAVEIYNKHKLKQVKIMNAQKYLERCRWPDGVSCPVCKQQDRIGQRQDEFYRCYPCKEDFTVRTGTIMERSHVNLDKWVQAILWVCNHQDITAQQLANKINVSWKTARSIIDRIERAGAGGGSNSSKVKQILSYQPEPRSAPAKQRLIKKKLAQASRSNPPDTE